MKQSVIESRSFSAAAEQYSANPFYEERTLEVAIECLADKTKPVELISAPGTHTGLVPLSRWLSAPPGLGSVWTVWDHIHCFDTTPADSGDVAAVLDSVLAHLGEKGASILRWPSLPTDTRFFRDLMRYLHRSGLKYRCTKVTARPLLHAKNSNGFDAEAIRLGGRRMAEFRRRRRRLEEMGRLSVRIHSGVHDAGVWMHDFLELEQSGWKGINRTAIACSPAELDYFTTLMLEAASQGKALVCSLELDGRPIAMTTNLRTGSQVWGFKTAYRNELARYSPGVLIACETTIHALEDPSITWMDSCMDSEDGIVGSIWHDRRESVDLVISTQPSNNWLPGAANMALNAFRLARTLHSAAVRSVERGFLKIVAGIASALAFQELPAVGLMTAGI